jgi:hypothetical protein
VMKWKADPWWKLGDVLQSPEWTWAHKKDDCDGFALRRRQNGSGPRTRI